MSELELRIGWERFVAPPDTPTSQQEYDSMLSRHAEPQRHYHTIDHVRWVLRHLDSFTDPDIDHGLAAAAAFYHDAIYDPASDDNETASAKLASSSLASLGWPTDRTEMVASIITATRHHRMDADVTTNALCCADLGVLAADPADYREYVNQVRREYGFVDDADWRTGRCAVLAGFVARDAIFDGRIVPADWEQRARANISAELATLNDD